jgi:Flp pilus assembly protein TadG
MGIGNDRWRPRRAARRLLASPGALASDLSEALARGISCASRFAQNESGVIMPLVALMLVALLGMAALAIDIPRYFDLQTQLQKAADACALAAAAELDGGSDAITRAQNAMTNLVGSANSTWAGVAQCQTPTFYASLPASDTSAMGATTADSTQARFVQVTTAPTSIRSFLPLTVVGLANNVLTARASAVAGFSQSVCGVTPIALCSGAPGSSTDFMNQTAMVGKEIVAPLGLGAVPSYDFIDVLGCGNDAGCVDQELGENVVPACQAVVAIPPLIPGTKTSGQRYYDSRLDIFNSNVSISLAPTYSPDVNVRKGYVAGGAGPNACGSLDTTGTGALPYPDDTNIAGNYSVGTIGNGVFSVSQYWKINYPGISKAPTVDDSGNAITTRYQLYQYEVNHSSGADLLLQSAGITSGKGKSKTTSYETGSPQCGGAANALQNRRIIFALAGKCTGGQLVSVYGVVALFIMEPMQASPGTGAVVAEYIGVAAANGANGNIHDIVRLYR